MPIENPVADFKIAIRNAWAGGMDASYDPQTYCDAAFYALGALFAKDQRWMIERYISQAEQDLLYNALNTLRVSVLGNSNSMIATHADYVFLYIMYSTGHLNKVLTLDEGLAYWEKYCYEGFHVDVAELFGCSIMRGVTIIEEFE